MLSRFIYLKEDSKFFIIATIVCALIILVSVTASTSGTPTDANSGYWAQIVGTVR